MGDLWSAQRAAARAAAEPLALRLRPRNLDEYGGQEHLVGPGRLQRRMREADRLTSAIFWGPPGTGKTALAEVIAAATGRRVERANAAVAGIADIRRILAESLRLLEDRGERTLLLLDEIHRFARNQQDVLLADLERGVVTLIGLTTENPVFALRGALVSRSTVFRFEPLSPQDVERLVRRALEDERGFGGRRITVDDDAIAHWARICDGDGRRALNALEVAVLSQPAGEEVSIDRRCAEDSIQAKTPVYGPGGDEHYDAASALIKSMRGSDPDAAVYWLARMLEAGEDPRFIARRVAVLASEDVGNADPRALSVAAAAWEITERTGMPECRYALAQAVLYMAAAPKSNASARAIWSATTDAQRDRTLPVPRHLRSVPDASVREGPGQKYVYPHDSADAYVPQDYLGAERVYYLPTDRGFERRIARRLARLRTAARARSTTAPGPDAGTSPPSRPPHD